MHAHAHAQAQAAHAQAAVQQQAQIDGLNRAVMFHRMHQARTNGPPIGMVFTRLAH